MTAPDTSIAVISTDREFLSELRDMLGRELPSVTLSIDIEKPYQQITDEDLSRLGESGADVILLDFDADPHVGLKFAQYLADAELDSVLVGAGEPLASDLLLEAMRAGIAEFISKPLEPEGLREAFDRIWRRLGKRHPDEIERSPGRLLVVFGAKGGAGCTTICTNLGIEIHRLTRERTLLLDLDLELGEIALQLGEDPEFSVVDLVRNFHRVDAGLLASYIEKHESGVEILSAPFRPAHFESVSADLISRILSFLREQYDYVVVDCPQALNPPTLAAIEMADDLLVVGVPDVPTVRNLGRCLPLMKDLGGGKRRDWIRLVLNRYESRGLISESDVAETVEREVFATLRNDFSAVMGSINTGEPVVLDGDSPFAQDIRQLASKITGVPVEESSGSGLLSGWLNSFRNGTGSSRSPSPSKRERDHA